jgi:hypothetical protein
MRWSAIQWEDNEAGAQTQRPSAVRPVRVAWRLLLTGRLVSSCYPVVHKRKQPKWHHAGGRSIVKKQVSHFNSAIFGLYDIGLDLRPQARAMSNADSFKPVPCGDFQTDD